MAKQTELAEVATPGTSVDLFISYSRRDQSFVRLLELSMEAKRRTAWVDWHSIPPTASWRDEVRAAIDAAQLFVFVVTPDSIDSRVCREELAHAVSRGKRVIPLLHRDVDSRRAPAAVASRNWIFCREEDDLDSAVETL